MTHRRRMVLLVAVLAQLAVPLALAGLAAADLAFGREVRLRAQPVDPLDVFRGNFVVLRYEISSVQTLFGVDRGDRICVELTERGGGWSGDRGLPEPVGEVAICGRARSDAEPGERVGVEYGIETYFASAERAREIESAIASGEVFAVVDLDDDGGARIERLEVDDGG